MVTTQIEIEHGIDEPLTPPLFERELEMRAARIKLVATDVDGVLTDGCVYYGDEGEVLKRFSLRDGMGVELLRADGIETAFVTRENSKIVSRRAEKLKIRHCYLGIADKVEPPQKLEGYGYDPARAEALPQRLGDALDALEADRELTGLLGDYFVTSFLAYKRNEIERFERFVTDWEFREYAYHL